MTYYDEPNATALEEMRARARKKRRIIYDCGNAIAGTDHVRCAMGKELEHRTTDGSINLLAVLRGRGCKACQNCEDFC